jgi:hypothetical protein
MTHVCRHSYPGYAETVVTERSYRLGPLTLKVKTRDGHEFAAGSLANGGGPRGARFRRVLALTLGARTWTFVTERQGAPRTTAVETTPPRTPVFLSMRAR